jgi:hypothetical protein
MDDKAAVRNVAKQATARLAELAKSNTQIRVDARHPRSPQASDSAGWSVECGSLKVGRKRFWLEVWLDKFPGTAERRLWYGITTPNHASMNYLKKQLPARLKPVKTLRASALVMNKDGGGYYQHKVRLPASQWNRTILELYPSEAFLGQYWQDSPLNAGTRRATAEGAIRFWRVVAQATKPLEEAIIEGAQSNVSAKVRDRSRRLRQAAIEEYREGNKLQCRACPFSAPVSGPSGVIEFHHKKPISTYALTGSKSSLTRAVKSLAPLCPTCHRIAHRRKDSDPYSIPTIRKIRATVPG